MSEEKTLELWNSVCETDPSMTKPFDNGTYSGTAIDPQYQFMVATKLFGPFGTRWRLEDERYDIVQADETTKVMFFYASLVYMYAGKEVSIPITSGVKFAYVSRSGRSIVDPEASKKVMTNAIGKGLSRLGFNADVYLGKFDDSTYTQKMSLMETVNGSTIDDRDIEIAKELIERTGSDKKAVLEYVKADSIEAMTQDQFSKFISAVKAKVKK